MTTWKVQHDLAPFKPHLWPSFPLSFSFSHNHLLLLKHTWHVPASETLHASAPVWNMIPRYMRLTLSHLQISAQVSLCQEDFLDRKQQPSPWHSFSLFSFLHIISDTPWFPCLFMCCLSPFPSSTESPEKTRLLGSFCLGSHSTPGISTQSVHLYCREGREAA